MSPFNSRNGKISPYHEIYTELPPSSYALSQRGEMREALNGCRRPGPRRYKTYLRAGNEIMSTKIINTIGEAA